MGRVRAAPEDGSGATPGEGAAGPGGGGGAVEVKLACRVARHRSRSWTGAWRLERLKEPQVRGAVAGQRSPPAAVYPTAPPRVSGFNGWAGQIAQGSGAAK